MQLPGERGQRPPLRPARDLRLCEARPHLVVERACLARPPLLRRVLAHAEQEILARKFPGSATQVAGDRISATGQDPYWLERRADKVIVALGTFAAKALLKTNDPISRLRGRVYDYRGAKLIPTFHPAFLLRSPERKRDVWDDMKKVRVLLQDPADSSD